jgi:ZIP family zinc transporter
MNPLIITTAMSFVSGVFGTGFGGLLTVVLRRPSRGMLAGLLAFAGGIMFSMVAFDLMPAAFDRGGVLISIPGLALGMMMMLFLDMLLPAKTSTMRRGGHEAGRYKRMGILIALGIALHNFAEGLAIGSGYVVTHGLGIGVAIIIAIHDVPEGIAMAAPLRLGGVSPFRVVAAAVATGLPTAFGGLIGGILGTISDDLLGICLSLAGGAMLSIVADQLLPDAREASDGHTSNIGFGIGVILGILLSRLC